MLNLARTLVCTCVFAGALSDARAERLTLEQAIAVATHGNYDLQLGRLQIESADVDEFASWAGVLPRLDLNASFGTQYYGPQEMITSTPSFALKFDPATNTGSGEITGYSEQVVNIPGQNFGAFSLGLKLQQPLFDGFRGPNQIRKARLLVTAASRQLDETELTVLFQVTRLFYEAVRAERGLAVLEETVVRSTEAVQRYEALFAAGRVQRGEVLAAQVNLGNDRINFEAQQGSVTLARNDLLLALGREPTAVLELVAPAAVDGEDLAAQPVPNLAALIERAKATRPGLVRYGPLLEAAKLDERIASADRYPVVGANLAYDRSGPTFGGTSGVWGNPAHQYVASASLVVQLNLFNGRQTSANEQRAALAERQVVIQSEQLQNQIAGEVARAWVNLQTLRGSLVLAAENLKSAEQGIKLAQDRLGAGAGLQLEVRDASIKLTQAKLALVGARIDFLVARADLARAVGGSGTPTQQGSGMPTSGMPTQPSPL